MPLIVRPLDLKTANRYVVEHHRHNGKVTIHRFSLGVYDDERLCGVAIVGNPVARKLDDGRTVEIHRCCTDGTRNACSILYGRCARVAKAMGWEKIITYVLESEPGTSLRAAGYVLETDGVGCGKNGWNMPSRPHTLVEYTLFGERFSYPLEKKKRYVKNLK